MRTFNVLASMPVRLHHEESFVYTAHWAHLERGRPDSSGDTIYNGAMDNAAGVAGLTAPGIVRGWIVAGGVAAANLGRGFEL